MQRATLFQGNLKKKQYFEGWYFKQVSFDEQHVISLIPGISLNDKDPHSFIQYIYFDKSGLEPISKTGYIRFEVEDFIWNDNPFTVKIGDNIFSETLVSVHLHDEDIQVDGNLQLGTFQDIKRTPYMPTIMGPFSYVPKMECYHEVISMGHLLKGTLSIGGKEIEFTGGKGYIEKDWGSNFPKQYVWLQCNHFENTHTSLFFSDAHIPFYGRTFQGHIATFYYDNREYRFATYLNSTIEVSHPQENRVRIILESKQAKIQIDAQVKQVGKLIAPVITGMERPIKEGISGEMYIAFYNKKTKEKYTDIGTLAGIEIVDTEDSTSGGE